VERNQIIVVCTGNICRSPMGERLLAHALAAESPPLNRLEVLSAGVAAFPGDPASTHSVRALAKVGLDLRDHRSRPFVDRLFDRAVAIFAMTEGHRAQLMTLPGAETVPILLFRELMDEVAEASVPDPFGANLDAYLETRDALAEAIPSIVKWLRARLAETAGS
jgi:protein-tyrosine-phosphatase